MIIFLFAEKIYIYPMGISMYFQWMKNVYISIDISIKCVTNGPINIIPALFQMMAWRHSGDKPFSEPMLA